MPLALREAEAQLTPATLRDAKRFLAPTLALVAPVSMTEGDQTAWLATATETLSGIPADLLERGCRAARKIVDHPAKIVAAIFADVGATWETRKRELGKVKHLHGIATRSDDPRRPWERDERPVEVCSPDDAAAILEEFGLRSAAKATAVRHAGPARVPTAADLDEIRRAMGLPVSASPDPVGPDGSDAAPIADHVERAVARPGGEREGEADGEPRGRDPARCARDFDLADEYLSAEA